MKISFKNHYKHKIFSQMIMKKYSQIITYKKCLLKYRQMKEVKSLIKDSILILKIQKFKNRTKTRNSKVIQRPTDKK
jgi:hypothetical protein